MCDDEYILWVNQQFEEAEMEEEGYTWGYYPQTPFSDDDERRAEHQDIHTPWAMGFEGVA